jgi:hypothetical protein
MCKSGMRWTGLALAMVFVVSVTAREGSAFSYVFAGEGNGVDIVTHSMGYSGTEDVIEISYGIDPASPHADAMVISVQNCISVWNGLTPTTGNVVFGELPPNEYDFESTLLHEMGHSLGLSHPNLGSQTGVSGPNTNYTQSTDGVDNTFNLAPGVDGVIGTADDIRGDDVNLNWFRKNNNDPFTIASTVDSNTYSRDLADLPGTDNYSANASRDVYNALHGSTNTEAIVQQGTYNGEAQRTLGHDDVAGILFAQTGLDETAGTADDYTYVLTYAGQTTSADIVIAFDNAETSLAVSKLGSISLGDDHRKMTSASIYFNTDAVTWYFNDTPVPEPATMSLLGLGAMFLIRRKRRA